VVVHHEVGQEQQHRRIRREKRHPIADRLPGGRKNDELGRPVRVASREPPDRGENHRIRRRSEGEVHREMAKPLAGAGGGADP
jgi:hypothetical protein